MTNDTHKFSVNILFEADAHKPKAVKSVKCSTSQEADRLARSLRVFVAGRKALISVTHTDLGLLGEF